MWTPGFAGPRPGVRKGRPYVRPVAKTYRYRRQRLLYLAAETRMFMPVMPDEPEPPRKFYEFKPNEFETVNPPTHVAQPTPPINVAGLIRQANSAKPGGVARASPASQANDVHGILNENLARANAAGLNELAPKPKRPSGRKRDYLFLMISGNVMCALLAFLSGGVGNPMIFVGAIGGMGLLTAALTWVMWFVMDDY